MDHWQRERELQGRIERLLADVRPDVHVLDVELDDPAARVRLFIDADGGVTLAVCTDVTALVHDLVPDHALEVSSPGERRPLRLPAHFDAHRGHRVRVRLRGARQPLTGTVAAVDSNSNCITVTRDDGSDSTLALSDIARCHLVPDTESPSTPRRSQS